MTSLPPVVVDGVAMPRVIYGTAWKEERTEALVAEAIAAGFRGIDTANQRKHYHEAGVGAALRRAVASGAVAREELFLQTKFTFLRGQDDRLPYDRDAPVEEQVRQSFASSLEHLGVDRIDSLVLHGPSLARGLGDADRDAWRAMEALHHEGKVRLLGVSNMTAEQVALLYAEARVKPAVVQHRTLVAPRADLAVRAFCRERGIAYQGFSLLTAAPALLRHPVVHAAAARLDATPAQVVLRHWLDQGIAVLTGTTSREHMGHDLALGDLALTPEESATLARLIEGSA